MWSSENFPDTRGNIQVTNVTNSKLNNKVAISFIMNNKGLREIHKNTNQRERQKEKALLFHMENQYTAHASKHMAYHRRVSAWHCT